MDRSLLASVWGIICLYLVLLKVTSVQGQSCGPRISARLLAEIPCDMSKSSYCSAPGSAYPWSSVKRYINDNQGLVRRMYGDEKHSSVLMNEIDGFRVKFEQLRSFLSSGYSRMEYGRSAKGSRRQPRPQIFRDDDDTPATIFRVVTETSIKVGDPITRPMTTETPTVTYQSAIPTEVSTETTPTTENHALNTTGESGTAATVTVNTTYNITTATATETTLRMQTFTETETPTTPSSPAPLPQAMERISNDYSYEYDYDPKMKAGSPVLENSVEEKTKYKLDLNVNKRTEHGGDGGISASEAPLYTATVDSTNEDPVEETEEPKEEIPRRGINACPVKNEVIAPYWANNTRGETLALLNVHPFEQYVHFEKCAFENHQMLCRDGCRCEQQYRLHRLLAFDPKNECRGIFSDWFRFPSCCVCICYDLTPDIPRSRRGRRN